MLGAAFSLGLLRLDGGNGVLCRLLTLGVKTSGGLAACVFPALLRLGDAEAVDCCSLGLDLGTSEVSLDIFTDFFSMEGLGPPAVDLTTADDVVLFPGTLGFSCCNNSFGITFSRLVKVWTKS